MENPYFSKKFFVFHFSLCAAAPPLKKIDFFEGRGGCTNAILLFIIEQTNHLIFFTSNC